MSRKEKKRLYNLLIEYYEAIEYYASLDDEFEIIYSDEDSELEES